MANPPFQVDGPPYPTDLPFYQTEALSWFRNNNDEAVALAGENISVETVRRLYAAGATRVDVVVTVNDAGPNPSELEVTFPKDGVEVLLAVIKTLRPTNWERIGGDALYLDDGSYACRQVTLSWH